MGYKNAALARMCMKPELAAALGPALCGTALVPIAAPVARAVPLTATYADKAFAYSEPAQPVVAAVRAGAGLPCKRYELLRGCVDHVN